VAAGNGIALWGNTTHAPKFADAAAHDYRPTTASPDVITHWSLWDGQAGAPRAALPAAVHTRATLRRRHRAPRHRHHAPKHRRRRRRPR
jgi:hypothetical protein